MVSPIIPPNQHRRYLARWLLNEDREKANEKHFKHPWGSVRKAEPDPEHRPSIHVSG